jgi:hypothetical protein
MAIRSGSRTVLQVSKCGDGRVEIALLTESGPAQDKQCVVIDPQDVSVLMELLSSHIEEEDPEDRSTLRSIRPVT